LSGHATRWSFWLQWAIGLSIIVGIAWGVYHEATAKPADTIYITLGELRSRAAEVQQVADNAAAERLTGTYIEAQSEQLAKAVAKVRDDLAKARSKGPAPGAEQAHALAEQLLALTQTLAEKGESITAAAAFRDQARAIVEALIPLERAARPT
jgi:hypothetical protein